MPVRQKLSREHVALIVHNMRIKYGNIIRNESSFIARINDTCIDCGWSINIGDAITSAWWTHRHITGFYAHVKCGIITDSSWLNDTSLIDVLARGEFNAQKCGTHRRQVTHKIIYHNRVFYVCDQCIES